MKKPTRVYVKRTPKYWLFRKINKHSITIWRVLIALMSLVILYALIARYVNRMPLISPEFIGPIQVEAKEPEVFISCDEPRGYLLCKAYSGEITWDEYEKLDKIFECESKYNPNALGTNIHKDGSVSVDRGIGQINNRYHKVLSNEDAFDFKKNIDYSIKLFKRSGAGQWSCSKIVL